MVEIYIILSLVIGIAIGFFLANQKNKDNDENTSNENENTGKSLEELLLGKIKEN